MRFAMFISFLPMLVLTFVAADNTTDYIHQLEQKISNLESHSQASEQKQAAVLASILSQLQSQAQEIDQLKANLTDSENSTATDCSLVSSGSHLVVFQGRTSLKMSNRGRIYFQQVTRNIGGGFSASTGVFTAPFSGTYQIWYNIQLGEVPKSNNPVLTVTGGEGATINSDYVPAVGSSDGRRKILHGIQALSLVKDDQVYLTLHPLAVVEANSSFGGVFLGDL